MQRSRRTIEFVIDYGSIALVALVGGIYLWGTIEPRRVEGSDGLTGLMTLLGVLLMLLAVRLWRDVRSDHDRRP